MINELYITSSCKDYIIIVVTNYIIILDINIYLCSWLIYTVYVYNYYIDIRIIYRDNFHLHTRAHKHIGLAKVDNCDMRKVTFIGKCERQTGRTDEHGEGEGKLVWWTASGHPSPTISTAGRVRVATLLCSPHLLAPLVCAVPPCSISRPVAKSHYNRKSLETHFLAAH